jgi:hypothetical protein
VKKNIYFEKESIFWLLGAFFMLLLAIFPKFIDFLASSLNISYPPSLLFLLSIVFIFAILFRQSQQISILHTKMRELIETNALIEERLRTSIPKTRDDETIE